MISHQLPGTKRTGGIMGQAEVHLDDDALLDAYGLRKPLQKLAADLAKQEGLKALRDTEKVIVGVELCSITFTRMTGTKDKG